MRPFKVNYHIAKPCRLMKIKSEIANYPKKYPVPKYLTFIEHMLESGWDVRLYVANRVSKYVFLEINDARVKVRFSNHKPLYHKEIENDCDYYVGISHTNVVRTDELINLLKYKYAL